MSSSSTHPDPTRLFPSLEAMRAVHIRLLERQRENGNLEELNPDIEDFLLCGQASGAMLESDRDREAAQSLLDYWSTRIYQPGYELPDAILVDFDPQLAPELDEALCPYRGLDAFTQENSSLFFGRKRLIKTLISRVKVERLLAVLGPSGSGKSSLVRAGLLPLLQAGAISGSEAWRYLQPLLPGSHPLHSLARLISADDKEVTAGRLRMDVSFLAAQFDQDVVLVVDQFEEVFTLCDDREERQAFVGNLLALADAPEYNHRVILTMRSDFEALVGLLPGFQPRFQGAVVQVTPLTAGELRETIEAPAQEIGLKFEDGVVEALLSDILGEPAALPLLQFTLLKLWENRDRNRVTWETYRHLGGGRQALAKTADELYESLIPEEQITARRILLRLVRPSETGLEFTSNRVRRDNLFQQAEARDRIERVLDKLITARLLRLTEGVAEEDAQVEVAHEALVRNWPRLVDWLEDEREQLRQRHRLTAAAEQWHQAARVPDYLWRGDQLAKAALYTDLTDLEIEFVKASRTAEKDEAAEKKAHKELQRRNRIIMLVGILAIIFGIMAGILAVRASNSEQQAIVDKKAAVTAQAVAEMAQARALAAQATAETAQKEAESANRQTQARLLQSRANEEYQDEPLFGMRLALESLSLARDDPQSLGTILGETVDLFDAGHVVNFGSDVVSLTPTTDDGTVFTLDREEGSSEIWNTKQYEPLARVPAPLDDVIFNADGSYFIVDYPDQPGELRSTKNGKVVATLSERIYAFSEKTSSEPINNGSGIFFSPELTDPPVFVVNYEEIPGEFWNIQANPDQPIEHLTDSDILNVDYNNGATVFFVDYRDINTPDELRRVSDGGVVATNIVSYTFSSEGSLVFINYSSAGVKDELRSTADGSQLVEFDSEVQNVTFSHDGSLVFVDYTDAGIADKLFSTADKSEIKVFDNEVQNVTFGPDGSHVVVNYSNTGVKDELLNIIDRKVKAIKTLNEDVSTATFSQNGTILTLNYSNRQNELLLAANGNSLASNILTVTFSPNEALFVVYYPKAQSELRRSNDGIVVAKNFSKARFNNDGSLVVLENTNSNSEVRRTANGEILARNASNVFFSQDTKSLVVDNRFDYQADTLMDAADGSVLFSFPNEIDKIIYSPDSASFIVQYEEPTLPAELRSSEDGALLVEFTHPDVDRISFSADGANFVVYYENGDVDVYRTGGTEPYMSLTNQVNKVQVLFDTGSFDHLLTSSSIDGQVTDPQGDTWTFFGQAGDVVTIDMEGMHSSLTLSDSEGNQLTKMDRHEHLAANNTISTINNFSLPYTGLYNINARGYRDYDTGPYTLTVKGVDFSEAREREDAIDARPAKTFVVRRGDQAELWNAVTGERLARFNNVANLTYGDDPDRSVIVVEKSSGLFEVWPTDNQNQPVKEALEVFFSPDKEAKYFITSYADQPGEIHPTAGGEKIIMNAEKEVAQVKFSPDELATYFVVQYTDRSSEVWLLQADTPHKLTNLGFNVADFIFDVSNQRMVVRYDNNSAYNIDLALLEWLYETSTQDDPEDFIQWTCNYLAENAAIAEQALVEKLDGEKPIACDY